MLSAASNTRVPLQTEPRFTYVLSSKKNQPLLRRRMLTEDTAVEIFMVGVYNSSATPDKRVRAEDLCVKYQVSSKTIRDIWSRRTWAEETAAFDLASASPMLHAHRQQIFRSGKNTENEKRDRVETKSGELGGTSRPSAKSRNIIWRDSDLMRTAFESGRENQICVSGEVGT